MTVEQLYKKRLRFDELCQVQLAKQFIDDASKGSWPDDPFFDVEIRIGRHILTLPVKAISKVVAIRQCVRAIKGCADVVGAIKKEGSDITKSI